MVTSMSRYSNKSSTAFTMIELIFAIVVVGVSLLTVPLMIQTNNKALEGNLAQEAIFLASAVVSVASTEAWDANSIVNTGDPDDYVLAKILDVGAVGTTFGRIDTASNIRQGGLLENKHRQFFDYNSSVADGRTLPSQTGTDILNLTIDNSVATVAGYKADYTVNAERKYVADTGGVLSTTASGVSNVKMLEIGIPIPYSDDINEVILRAYTANIGEVDYAKRSF